MTALACVWDWYEMTFDTIDDDRVPKSLAIALGGSLSRVKGRNGYAEGWAVERDSTVLATVFRASPRAGEVHIAVTGGACREVVPTLRRMWPAHRVTRADAAMDFHADFDVLDRRVQAFGGERGLSMRSITNSDGGATTYVGSARSEFQVRAYKKTEEQRQKHPESAQEVPDGIVRIEATVRPGKRAVKERVAAMTPDDVYGLSAWGQEFAREFVGVDAERVATHFRRPPEWVRTLHYLGLQYGPSAAKRAEEVGIERARDELLAALGLAEPVAVP
ncbi:replication initiation factor domain-containing protein [Curtobacterium sp. PhB115]|uniref:replication initiation factor domain-containing protein n=1 Tax=Curtobacterium sp. PhB115 TaxID=2485173 RepID=UPI000FBA788B|nr:replication initiation factor domain-containing protein [Curtobacterium sp. PhB115]ROP78973.1 hypothetical protein EDF19_0048 [Curtobacterium sp. PhB115]